MGPRARKAWGPRQRLNRTADAAPLPCLPIRGKLLAMVLVPLALVLPLLGVILLIGATSPSTGC